MTGQPKTNIPNRMPKKASYTLAQRSNFLAMTAALYDVWRVRSISLLTKENFSLEREFALLLEWVRPKADMTFLDVGTSTGNYANVLAESGAKVTAIDMSLVFLERAAVLHPNPNIRYEQANAEQLPYPDSSFDGAVLGATLNEFFHTELALQEIARVLKPDGKLFIMYLCESESSFGRFMQLPFKLIGVRFPNREWLRQTLNKMGFERPRAEMRRAVVFEMFVKTGQSPRENPEPTRKLSRTAGKPARDPLEI